MSARLFQISTLTPSGSDGMRLSRYSLTIPSIFRAFWSPVRAIWTTAQRLPLKRMTTCSSSKASVIFEISPKVRWDPSIRALIIIFSNAALSKARPSVRTSTSPFLALMDPPGISTAEFLTASATCCRVSRCSCRMVSETSILIS